MRYDATSCLKPQRSHKIHPLAVKSNIYTTILDVASDVTRKISNRTLQTREIEHPPGCWWEDNSSIKKAYINET